MFPSDLEAWERQAQRRGPIHQALAAARSLRHRGRPEADQHFTLASAGDEPAVVAALDVPRGTSLDAVVSPVREPSVAGAVLVRGDMPARVVPADWSQRTLRSLDELPASVRWVLSAGSYRAVSLPLHAWARAHDVPFGVVQHGALTPYAPPLPPGSCVFAWSDADLAFWGEGRADVTGQTVGSQMLWTAARDRVEAAINPTPLWLGQLHGSELPKRLVEATSRRFCLAEDADYRPHPAEMDAASRVVHAVWQRQGIRFDRSGVPLRTCGRPVVSIFSSGILEAAAQGLPAWRYCPGAPSWLEEFWDRYGMRAWGGEPTRVEVPDQAPASAIAAALTS